MQGKEGTKVHISRCGEVNHVSGLDQVVLGFRFVALVEMVEIVIPVQSVEYEKAHREYQDEDDIHQPGAD